MTVYKPMYASVLIDYPHIIIHFSFSFLVQHNIYACRPLDPSAATVYKMWHGWPKNRLASQLSWLSHCKVSWLAGWYDELCNEEEDCLLAARS